MINDWVNAQESHLLDCTDTTKPNHVREEDEVLWAEFEMAFADAWMDTSKKQNAEHAQKHVCKFRGAETWD